MTNGLDRLLRESIAAAMEHSGATRERLLNAPDLVLSVRPGLWGAPGLLVAIVPSQDRVGRVYPLCVGVQWVHQEPSLRGWPSVEFGQALVACARGAVARGADPDELLSGLANLSTPGRFSLNQEVLTGDETVPRLGSGTQWVRIRRPLTSGSAALVAVCSILHESSDLLGIQFSESSEPQDFLACRRLESAAPLAALFDGLWAERGWASFQTQTQTQTQTQSPAPLGPPASASVPILPAAPDSDDDATRPRRSPLLQHLAPPPEDGEPPTTPSSTHP